MVTLAPAPNPLWPINGSAAVWVSADAFRFSLKRWFDTFGSWPGVCLGEFSKCKHLCLKWQTRENLLQALFNSSFFFFPKHMPWFEAFLFYGKSTETVPQSISRYSSPALAQIEPRSHTHTPLMSASIRRGAVNLQLRANSEGGAVHQSPPTHCCGFPSSLRTDGASSDCKI